MLESVVFYYYDSVRCQYTEVFGSCIFNFSDVLITTSPNCHICCLYA